MRKNTGFGVAGIVLIVAVVALAGLVGWQLYDANKSQQSATGTSNQTQQTSQSDQAQPSDPNEGYVVIKEWGVRFKPAKELGEVEYFRPSDIHSDAITFTTKALSEAATSCAASSKNIILGLLTRSTDTIPGNGGVVATVSGYTYQYQSPQATCGAGDLETKVVPQISQSLKTLEAAK